MTKNLVALIALALFVGACAHTGSMRAHNPAQPTAPSSDCLVDQTCGF